MIPHRFIFVNKYAIYSAFCIICFCPPRKRESVYRGGRDFFIDIGRKSRYNNGIIAVRLCLSGTGKYVNCIFEFKLENFIPEIEVLVFAKQK